MKVYHSLRRSLAIFLIPPVLAGCSWLSGGKPVQPVSPLLSIANPVSGSVAWRRDAGDGSELERLQIAAMNGRIFATEEDGVVTALDARSGATVWTTDTDVQITGGVGAGDGLALVGTAEGEVIALDAASGAERWRSAVSSEILAAPAAANGVAVVRTNDGKVVGLSAADGTRLWTFQRDVPVLSLRGTAPPVTVGQHAICGMDGGRLVSIEIATGRPAWEVLVAYPTGRSDLSRVVDIDGRPLILGNTVYVTTFQGALAAVDIDTGAIRWTIPLSSYNGVGAVSGMIFASDDLGHLKAVDESTGETVWTQKALSGRRLSPPAGVGAWVAVGDLEGYVHWVNPSTGDIAGRTRAVDSPVRAPLLVEGGTVFVTGVEGEVAAVQAPSP